MTATMIKVPQFRKGERVNFIGGAGTIKNHRLESGIWTYLIEMEMGPEPLMGRVGFETMVLLPEPEIVI